MGSHPLASYQSVKTTIKIQASEPILLHKQINFSLKRINLRLEGIHILTTVTSPSLDFRRKTKRVDRMTDVNGAAAEIQKRFGFLEL